MSKHNHDTCKHNLKHCKHCDVVYCTKCEQEWGGHKHYYPWWGWSYTGIPASSGTITITGDNTATISHHNNGPWESPVTTNAVALELRGLMGDV